VSFVLPSKSGLFQPDLYPPFPSNTAGNDFENWSKGTDKKAVTMELRPEKSGGKNKAKAGGLAAKLAGKAVSKEETKDKSVDELKKEIEDLKKQLAAGGGAKAESKEDLTTKPVLGYWSIRGLG